jgi:hypothetical protein
MRATGFAAIVLVAVSAGAAHAELFDAPDWAPDWYRRLEGLAQSLIGGRPPDHGIIKPPIIKPPGNIDPQMVLVPPEPLGAMRIITPPGRAPQR